MAHSLRSTQAILPTPPPSSPQSRVEEQDLALVEAMLLERFAKDEERVDIPKPPPQHKGYQGFFVLEVALARSKPDTAYIQLILSCYAAGVFRGKPQAHPLYTGALSPYMARYGCPLGMNCALQHLQFFNSNFGLFFSNFDSDIGVPPATFKSAMQSAVLCNRCLCFFSPPGFLAHAPDGECKNWYAHNQVNKALLHRSERDLNLSVTLCAVRFKEATGEDAGEEVKAPAPTLEEVAIKAAFIEWNSRVGVTQEVWALLTTSDVLCNRCSRVRTWRGYMAHLDEGRHCTTVD